ncbi:MAG: BatD family protein [Puniceicoccales bacterium]|jgi:hypothetical protein|nr:BatD family protein [Puniceicoccales bacterium]
MRICATLTPTMSFSHHSHLFKRLAATAAACVAFACTLAAQTVQWSPSGGSLAKDQPAQLDLVFENCDPSGPIAPPPAVAGLEFSFLQSSQSHSTNIINGRTTRRSTTTHHYRVRVSTDAPVTIPAFTVETSAGKLTVPAASFTVGKATVGRGTGGRNVQLEDIANATLRLPATNSVWAGEVFDLTLNLLLDSRYAPRLAGTPTWENPPPLVVEDWAKTPTEKTELHNGERFIIAGFPTRALALRDGTAELPVLRQDIALASGRSSFFGPGYEQYSLRTTATTLTVKPLPLPAPANFAGAVGQFKFTAKAVPEKVAVGDPVTWTLELSGTGNWPAITALPARDVSRDFRVIQPRAQKTTAEGKLFDATLGEDIVLIPTRAGSYTLGPVEISIFNPQTGTYETLRAPATTVEVTPNANTPPAPANAAQPAANGTDATAAPTPATAPTAATPPPAPAAIPLDPLPNAAPATAPIPRDAFLLRHLLPAALWPLLIWLLLAWQRARRTDPTRPRREARKHLKKILREIAADATDPRLLAWQHATATFWDVDTAAPNARQIPDPSWAALWQETDRVLYHRDATLSAEWHTAAQKALATTPYPRFAPWRIFRGKNLFPFFFALALLTAPMAALAADNAPATPAAAYARADFKAAETAWSAQLRDAPADWSARHNLSLALAQQDRWAESAAHATAAFVQHPRHPAVRWQLRLALGKAGYTPAPLAPFLAENPQGALTATASPAQWQYTLIGAVGAVALGIALALARTYRVVGKWGRWPAGALVLAGALVAIGAVTAIRAYGPLADERAAVVWRATTLYSVPTEADTEQKTTPIAAGAVVLLGKDFLGWRQVTFPNAQTGWVRTENLTPIWR